VFCHLVTPSFFIQIAFVSFSFLFKILFAIARLARGFFLFSPSLPSLPTICFQRSSPPIFFINYFNSPNFFTSGVILGRLGHFVFSESRFPKISF